MKQVAAIVAILVTTIPVVSSAALIVEQPDNSSTRIVNISNYFRAHLPSFTASGTYSLGSFYNINSTFDYCAASTTGTLKFSAKIPVGRNFGASFFHDSATPTPHGLQQVTWGNIATCSSYLPGNGVMTDYSMPITLPITGSNLSDSNIINGETYHVIFGETLGYTMDVEFKTDANGNISYQLFDDATSTPATTTPPVCTEDCNSNVMFLPGLEASRLFAQGTILENQIWLPNSPLGNDVPSLDMDNPASINEVYTKGENIVDAAYNRYNVYISFIDQMNQLKANGEFDNWKPVAYDWRLDYENLLTQGKQTNDGKIYYRGSNASTSSDPYIVQQLKSLAATSRTGKVTIVAHSNGGLLAKQLLSHPEYAQYVDTLILVGSPQLGTPQAVGALLHGFNQALPKEKLPIFLSDADARYLSLSMPIAYNLLPSNQYFLNTINPVVTFDPAMLPEWVQKYGGNINTKDKLRAFMTDVTRTDPSRTDIVTPEVVNSALYDNAVNTHAALDSWVPPNGVQLITIAGWGNSTVSGIKYTKLPKFVCSLRAIDGSCSSGKIENTLTYTPQFVVDGDGTVVESSSQWTNGATATRYWINLMQINAAASNEYSHANILEVPQARTLLQSLITGASTSTLPQYVGPSRPSYSGSGDRLYFVLHSPLTLGFKDGSGKYSGSTATSTTFEVNGVDYERFGEVQWLSVPKSLAGTVVMQGTGSGSFALEVQEANGNQITNNTTFAAIESATNTVATVSINPQQSPTRDGKLVVDFNGDGSPDKTLLAKQGAMVLPDTTAPEATISVSTSTKDLLVVGLDESSTTISKSATSTVITDASGNKTTLFFQKQFSGSLLTYARITGISYGTSTVSVPSSFLFVWDSNKNPVSQSVVVGNQVAIQALYDSKKDKTTIIVLKKNIPIQTVTLPGLRLVKLSTNKGVMVYSW